MRALKGMRTTLRVLGILLLCAAPLAAQDEAAVGVQLSDSTSDGQIVGKPAGPPPTPEHTGVKAMLREIVVDVTNLPSKQNLFWLAVGGGAAAGAHQFDTSVNSDLVGPTWAHRAFVPGAYLGQSYTLLTAAGIVYVTGRAKDLPRVSHMGSDLIQSVAIAELMTQGLKYTVRRERPDGSGANGFPSGHAADTFAFATALERHFGWKYAVPGYLFASYVAASRLHDNVHYLSDVVFGSAVGIIAGRTVTRHGRENFPVAVVPMPGGGAVMYTRTLE